MRGKGEEREKEVKEEEDISRLLLGIMEGYKDSVIPTLPDLSPEGGTPAGEKDSGTASRCRGGASETESIRMERDRREKMSHKFSVLQSMVPNPFTKATRERIVSDTIEYIQRLEEERKRLENLKKSLSQETMAAKPALSYSDNQDSSVNVAVSGSVAFFGIQLAFRRRLVTTVFRVFEKHRAEVLAANVSVNDQRQLTLTVTALVGGNGDDDAIENIRRDILTI